MGERRGRDRDDVPKIALSGDMAHDGQSGGEIVMDMIDRVKGEYTALFSA